ncbi:hypothetical protein HDZ31DRAFT_44361 [Schizophyllum fasciatum]
MRRSARIAGLYPEDALALNKPNATHDRDPAQALKAPPRKRQKTKAKKRIIIPHDVHYPALSLQMMPLDILLEILVYLGPVSLLHLSRVSWAFHDILMSRSSISLWKRSYDAANRELPPVPEDLNIPRFLSLAVDNYCDYCHRTFPKYDYVARVWALRLRCCEDCMFKEKHVVKERDLGEIKIVKVILRYLGRGYNLRSIFPSVEFHLSMYFPRAGIESLAEDFERDNKRKLVAAKKSWLIERAAVQGEINKHAGICATWEQKENWKKAEEKEKVKEKRRADILIRLKDMGWYYDEARHLEYDYFYKEHAFVRKARPLTDHEWNRDHRQLLRYLEENRTRRLAYKKSTTIRGRYCSLSQVYKDYLHGKSRRDQARLPGIGDLVAFEEVIALVEGTPVEQELPQQKMRTLLDTLAQQRFSDWRAARIKELLDILNEADTQRNRPATAADLRLAATFFAHKDWSVKPLWYPNVLQERKGSHWLPDEDPQRIVNQRAWSAEYITASVAHLRLAERIITKAGLDPATATPADMDGRDAWFAYAKDMSTRSVGLRAMSWRSVVRCPDPSAAFVLTSDQDTAWAREMCGKHHGGSVDLPGLTKKGLPRKRRVRS